MKKLIKVLSVASIMALGLNAQSVHLERGWNNIGLIGATSVTDFNTADANNSLIIWKYNAQENKWLFYSNVESYENQVRQWITDGANYGLLNTLNAGDAVWVKSDRAIDINIGAIAYTNIRGFVKNAVTNEPINNFSVIIDGHEQLFTDANGTFDIQNVTVAHHDINISAEGYEGTNINVDIDNPVPVDLGQIKLIPQQNAVENIELRGDIVNAVTGEKVDNPVRLRLFQGYNNTDGNATIDTIVNNGEYDINISSGTYTVVLSADGYRDTTYNYTFASDNNNEITQNFAIAPIDANVTYALRATLTWGANPSDLDSHFLAYAPDSNHSVWHIYYSNEEAYENDHKVADLDVDDTSSYGPEHVTLYDLNTSMKYVYYVWNYSGNSNAELKNSNADVKVYYNGQLYDFSVPYADGMGWKVFEIDNGVLVPCQTNCMVSSDFDIYNLRSQDSKVMELINTANSPK